MKSYLSIFAFIALFAFASCKKTSDSDLTTETLLAKYHWTITNLNDKGTDRTTDYSGYDIQFRTDSVFVATLNSTTTTGSWKRNNASTENPKILIQGITTSPLNLLNEDWKQVSRTDLVMQFSDEKNPAKTVTFTKK